MVHYLGIVLVIWGFLAQPLMAALPGYMQVHPPVSASAPNLGAIASVSDLDHTLPVPAPTSDSLNPNDHGEQAAEHRFTASTMPCHQIVESDLPKRCGKCLTGHCDSGCLSASHCGSTCSAPGTVGAVGSFYKNTMNHAACDLFNTAQEPLWRGSPHAFSILPKRPDQAGNPAGITTVIPVS